MDRTTKFPILLSVVLTIGIFLTGCGAQQTYPPVGHTEYAADAIDFSEQAQIYMEYIATNFPDRTGLSGDHNAARDFIVSELIEAGYPAEQITLQKVKGKSGKNIILKVPGSADDPDVSIVAGAHYDGDGAGDNASGVALLLAQAVNLVGRELPVTTYYVFFDQEETGCHGSETFVDRLSPEQLQSVLYMVNIDAIAFGDYCNVYGGRQDRETGDITQTEVYDHVCAAAAELDYNVYGTEELDGYFAAHGAGPALDPNGIFTNPWTKANPAPGSTLSNEFCAYSPTTLPVSDHAAFLYAGIPYVYFESTNWYTADPDGSDISYTGYSDVGDLSLGKNGCIMNTEFDTLDYLNEHFPGRAREHFRLYSPLLTKLITEPYGG